MRATLKLLNAYFWKTIYGPILVFIFPSILFIILGGIMRTEYVLPGIISLVTMFIAVQVMPLGIMELKNSTLFKYIGSTPVNPKRFAISVIIFYVALIVGAILMVLLVGAAAFHKQVFTSDIKRASLYSGLLSAKGFWSFVAANGIHILMSLGIGLAIATFSKTPQQALTIALIIVLPSMFLSGMVLTFDIIAESKIMQWISRFVIFRYTTANIVIASTPISNVGSILDHINTTEQLGVIFNKDFVNKSIVIDGVRYFRVDDNIPLRNILTSANSAGHLNGQIAIKDASGAAATSSTEWYINIKDIKSINDFLESNVKFSSDLKTFKGMAFSDGDSTLFTLIFTDKSFIKSDNNIFNFLEDWGIRKIPDVDRIKQFIIKYFQGNTVNQDPKRFAGIWVKIQNNDYNWLEMFMNQNIELFTKAERALNIVLPALVFGGSVWFVSRKFNWSAR